MQQETFVPSDPGFVVEWQLADEADGVIDLSTAEAEGRMAGSETSSTRVSTPR